MTFDPTKPVVAIWDEHPDNDPRPARIISTDYKSDISSVIALVESNLWRDKEDLWFADETGKKVGGVNPSGKRLVNIPETHEVKVPGSNVRMARHSSPWTATLALVLKPHSSLRQRLLNLKTNPPIATGGTFPTYLKERTMEVFVVLINDRHAEPEVAVYDHKETAVNYARGMAKDLCRYDEDYEESQVADWVFFASCSPENDYVRVTQGTLAPQGPIEDPS